MQNFIPKVPAGSEMQLVHWQKRREKDLNAVVVLLGVEETEVSLKTSTVVILGPEIEDPALSQVNDSHVDSATCTRQSIAPCSLY